MSRRVESSAAKTRTGTVAIAALIALLVTYTALPLCCAALTCTMPCCKGSSHPMETHDCMPAPGCGGTANECSVARVPPVDIGATLAAELDVPHALAAAAPHAFSDIAPPAGSSHAPLVQPRTDTRLYVVNDAFLI